MSTWHGPSHKGAMRELRKVKHLEAEERNERTPPARRRRNRGRPVSDRGQS